MARNDCDRKRDAGMHLSMGLVFGSIAFFVFLIGLAVWIATLLLSSSTLSDLEGSIHEVVAAHVHDAAASPFQRAESALDLTMAQLASGVLSSIGGFEGMQMMALNATMTSFGLSGVAFSNPTSGAVTGVFRGPCSSSWGAFGSPASAAATAVATYNATTAVSTITTSTASLTELGVEYPAVSAEWRNGTYRWPFSADTLQHLRIGAVTLANGTTLVAAVAVSTATASFKMSLVQPKDQFSAVVVDASNSYMPVIAASRDRREVRCNDSSVSSSPYDPSYCQDSSSGCPISSALTLSTPAVVLPAVDTYVKSRYQSWSMLGLNTSGALPITVKLAGGTLYRIQQLDGELAGFFVVVGLKSSDYTSFEDRIPTLVAIVIVAAVIQLSLVAVTVVLIHRPLKRLRVDINKAAQLDSVNQDFLDSDRIGGFNLLNDDDIDSLMEEVEEEQEKRDSLFSEVAALQRGFREMLTVIRSFTLYVPPDIVTRLIKKGELASLSMSHRVVSLMFIDVEGFTNMCEEISERRLVKTMEVYFGITGEVIADTGGTVDKYIGDAVMAFWGAPTKVDNINIRASLAALMIGAQISHPDTQETMGDRDFRIRIGVHSGRALCGNLGSRKRMNFTALGDVVNLSSRLEGLNKEYGTRIMISSTVARDLTGLCQVRQLGRVTVKGKSIATEVYELVGVLPEAMDSAVGHVQDGVSDSPLLRTLGEAGLPSDPRTVRSRRRSTSMQGDGSVYTGGGGSTSGGPAWDYDGSTAFTTTSCGGAVEVTEPIFSVPELLACCASIVVDADTIAFCTTYTNGVREYLRGDFCLAVETFATAGRLLDSSKARGQSATDNTKRRRCMEELVREMENILNSGFGGGMCGGGGGGGGGPLSGGTDEASPRPHMPHL